MKSEQSSEEMVDILQHIHQYVPKFASGNYYPVFFDGDQLTRERAGGAQDAKLQSDKEDRKLRGVIPETADWHTLVVFYQVFCVCICTMSAKVCVHTHVCVCVSPTYICTCK